MRPRTYPEAEGCTWCGRPASFRLLYALGEAPRFARRCFACELHIADARRRLCVVRVDSIEAATP
jgi:hypothetical protein